MFSQSKTLFIILLLATTALAFNKDCELLQDGQPREMTVNKYGIQYSDWSGAEGGGWHKMQGNTKVVIISCSKYWVMTDDGKVFNKNALIKIDDSQVLREAVDDFNDKFTGGGTPDDDCDEPADPNSLKCPQGYKPKYLSGTSGPKICALGSKAISPMTPAMRDKCRLLGGGKTCSSNTWNHKLLRAAWGNGTCPRGTKFDAKNRVCTDGKNIFGALTNAQFEKCKKEHGASVCESGRWPNGLLALGGGTTRRAGSRSGGDRGSVDTGASSMIRTAVTPTPTAKPTPRPTPDPTTEPTPHESLLEIDSGGRAHGSRDSGGRRPGSRTPSGAGSIISSTSVDSGASEKPQFIASSGGSSSTPQYSNTPSKYITFTSFNEPERGRSTFKVNDVNIIKTPKNKEALKKLPNGRCTVRVGANDIALSSFKEFNFDMKKRMFAHTDRLAFSVAKDAKPGVTHFLESNLRVYAKCAGEDKFYRVPFFNAKF